MEEKRPKNERVEMAGKKSKSNLALFFLSSSLSFFGEREGMSQYTTTRQGLQMPISVSSRDVKEVALSLLGAHGWREARERALLPLAFSHCKEKARCLARGRTR